jgi:hypothetical protein
MHDWDTESQLIRGKCHKFIIENLKEKYYLDELHRTKPLKGTRRERERNQTKIMQVKYYI